MPEHNRLVRNRGLVVPHPGQIFQHADTFLRKRPILVNNSLKTISVRTSIFQANLSFRPLAGGGRAENLPSHLRAKRDAG